MGDGDDARWGKTVTTKGEDCNDLYLICGNGLKCVEQKFKKVAGYDSDDCSIENTICDTENKKCKCNNGYIYVDGKCTKLANLGENCDAENVCNTLLLQKCDSTGKCVCENEFKELAGNCFPESTEVPTDPTDETGSDDS